MQEHMKKKKFEIVRYMEEKGITIQEYKVFLPKPKKSHLELLLSITGLKYSSANWLIIKTLYVTVVPSFACPGQVLVCSFHDLVGRWLASSHAHTASENKNLLSQWENLLFCDYGTALFWALFNGSLTRWEDIMNLKATATNVAPTCLCASELCGKSCNSPQK